MKLRIALVVGVAATPALAHHEVVMATSMIPLASGLAAITLAGLALWRNRRRRNRRVIRSSQDEKAT